MRDNHAAYGHLHGFDGGRASVVHTQNILMKLNITPYAPVGSDRDARRITAIRRLLSSIRVGPSMEVN